MSGHYKVSKKSVSIFYATERMEVFRVTKLLLFSLTVVVLMQLPLATDVKAGPSYREYIYDGHAWQHDEHMVYPERGSRFYNDSIYIAYNKSEKILSDSSMALWVRNRKASVEFFEYLRRALIGNVPSNTESRCIAMNSALIYYTNAIEGIIVENGMFARFGSGPSGRRLGDYGWSGATNRESSKEILVYFGLLIMKSERCGRKIQEDLEERVCYVARTVILKELRKSRLIVEETPGGAYLVVPTFLAELPNHPDVLLDTVAMSDVLDVCMSSYSIDKSGWVKAAAYAAMAYHAGNHQLAEELFAQSQ